jgi:hypothetical protein
VAKVPKRPLIVAMPTIKPYAAKILIYKKVKAKWFAPDV